MNRRLVAQGDCFKPWEWQGPPWAIKQAGPWTLTDSNGGGYYVLWYFNRVHSRGGRKMIDEIFDDKLQLFQAEQKANR